jgi:APA family basic amino acid/polyamine antiporter
LPRSGGEYRFLSRIYAPALGQVAGWVSVTVGFSAPIALAAMALGLYLSAVMPLDPLAVAVAAVLGSAALHGLDLDLGRGFQVVSTLLKVLLMALFCAAGLCHVLIAGPAPGSASPLPSASTWAAVWSLPFGQSLILVAYAYSGWNACAYLAEEVEDPERTVPRAMILGTAAVTGLYLLLNLAFLLTVPLDDLAGAVEVGAVSAERVLGPGGGLLVSLSLGLLLCSTLSAMALAGPRVLGAMGEDLPSLGALARRNRRGAPTRAVLLQQGLALALVLTGAFEAVLTLAGVALSLFACLTVAGVLRLRRLEPDLPRPFRVPLYPWPPLVFLAASGVALLSVAWERPLATLAVLSLLAVVVAALGRRWGGAAPGSRRRGAAGAHRDRRRPASSPARRGGSP